MMFRSAGSELPTLVPTLSYETIPSLLPNAPMPLAGVPMKLPTISVFVPPNSEIPAELN